MIHWTQKGQFYQLQSIRSVSISLREHQDLKESQFKVTSPQSLTYISILFDSWMIHWCHEFNLNPIHANYTSGNDEHTFGGLNGKSVGI